MTTLVHETTVADEAVYARTVERFREAGLRLPTFAELARPDTMPAVPETVDPDTPHAQNLFRVHWFNAHDRRSRVDVPGHVVLPEALTGVPAPIVCVFGYRFPMIRAHKVLAAYGCLVPRLVTGRFAPTSQRAVWPSTGNYCRGGVAISRILGCRGVAVLPEGMSDERFAWLANWVTSPEDVIRTFGTESNVKEIYDKCNELEREPDTVIFNQFREFGNHLAHVTCTGPALETVFRALQAERPELNLAAFVSATGSAGTIAAGDHLKDVFGTKIVAAEALECPTMLYNGFGEHNIQGIGDKHIPYIHNVTNTDFVSGVSDRSTDALNVLFNTDAGREYLVSERGLASELVEQLTHLGFSSVCNALSAVKLAKLKNLGPNDVVITVATDGAELYTSEIEKATQRDFPSGFGRDEAARVFAEHLEQVDSDHIRELDQRERDRIFNLGYFTWVEQQGVALEDFDARRDQSYWQGLRELVPAWDERIRAFNEEAGSA